MNKKHASKKIYFLIIVMLIYVLIWLFKGQPLLTRIDNTWKYTYANKYEFDDEYYTEKDLKKMKRFEWVEDFFGTFRNTDNVDFMKNMSKLKRVIIGIYVPNNIIDWSGINNCTNIEHILISGGELSDLNSFVNLNKLTYLTLCEGKAGSEIDLGKISELKSLEYLIIEGYSVKNCESVKELSRLKSVIITGKAIDILSYLPSESVEIFCCNSGDNFVVDSSEFVRLYNLKSIALYGGYIKDIGNLSNLKNLESVSISGDLYTDEELKILYDSGISVTT